MQDNSDSKDPKKPYEKPVLRTIELAADEVLAVGCKVKKGQSGFNNRPNSCLHPRTCYGRGS